MTDSYRYYKSNMRDLVIRAKIDETNRHHLCGHVVREVNTYYTLGEYSRSWTRDVFDPIKEADVDPAWCEIRPEKCKSCEYKSCNNCGFGY